MRTVNYHKLIVFCIMVFLLMSVLIVPRKIFSGGGVKQENGTEKVKVLLDTDIGGDVDDVGALVILNNYVNQGAAELLAVGVSAYNPYSAGVIDAVCRYYGNTDIRIGQCDFTDGQIDYTDEQLEIYSKPLYYGYDNRFANEDKQPEQVIDMYREILEDADDRSVVFVSIGFLNNLCNLLQSKPDHISPLSGRELVQRKVSRLVCMGGCFLPMNEEQKGIVNDMGLDVIEYCEFNVSKWPQASKTVAEAWPTEKVFVGFEAGLVKCGSGLKQCSDGNPAKTAYARYTIGGSLQRHSWDPIAVLYACMGGENHDLFELSAAGSVSFDENGRTFFKESDSGDSKYLIWKESGENIARKLDEILSVDGKPPL